MKSLQDIKVSQNLKTLRGERRGSIPKEKRSQFLELYLHEQERARLQHEIKVLGKKMVLNQKKLETTIENINNIRKKVNADENMREGNPVIVPFETMESKLLPNRKTNHKKRSKSKHGL